jgi:hypothetical protein
MVELSGVNFVGRHHSGIDDCMTIVEIINALLRNGHTFTTPCEIDRYYDPFRDLSFKNFYQPPSTTYTAPTTLVPMFTYGKMMYTPYPNYLYIQPNNGYYSNTYPGTYPPSKKRKRPNKGKRRQQNPAPKVAIPALQIAVSKSDLSL